MALLRRRGGLLAGGMGRAGTFSPLPSSGPTTLASDTFTDTNSTALNAHTMDVGSGWTHRLGTLQIQSNTATVNTYSSDLAHATTDVGAADGVIDVDVTSFNDGGGVSTAIPTWRYVDDSNFWFQQVLVVTDAIEMYEKTGGSNTLRDSASVTINSGTSYAIKMTLAGNVMTTTLDDANELTYTSASHNTATDHGIFAAQTSTGTPSAPIFDNWIATT